MKTHIEVWNKIDKLPIKLQQEVFEKLKQAYSKSQSTAESTAPKADDVQNTSFEQLLMNGNVESKTSKSVKSKKSDTSIKAKPAQSLASSHSHVVAISALDGTGVDVLTQRIQQHFASSHDISEHNFVGSFVCRLILSCCFRTLILIEFFHEPVPLNSAEFMNAVYADETASIVRQELTKDHNRIRVTVLAPQASVVLTALFVHLFLS
jgi:50S ribosomal subunit-associated GTPase HflX